MTTAGLDVVLRAILSRRLPSTDRLYRALTEMGIEPTYRNGMCLALTEKAVRGADLSAIKLIREMAGEQQGAFLGELSALTDTELRALIERGERDERL